MKCGDHGGVTSKGDRCTRPAAWGRDAATGKCQLHHEPAEDGRRRDGDEDGDDPPPPAHLSDEAAAVWVDVLDDWHLNAAERELFQSGLESLDLYKRSMAEVRRDGPTVETPNGTPKRHPAALAGRDAIRDYRATMKELPIALGDLEER